MKRKTMTGLGMNNRWLRLLPLLVLPLAAATPAAADELAEVRSLRDTTIALVNLLVEQGVLSREKADELIRKAQEAGKASSGTVAGTPGSGAPSGSAPGVVRVPYVPELVKQQIREEVKQDVLAQARTERWGDPGVLPRWLDKFTFSGDIRFRGQADRFPSDNVPNALPQQLQLPDFGAYNINNTSDPRNRMRLRVRFGADVAVADTVTAGLRLTTGSVGNGGDPSTENQNLGNYNTRSTVGFDRAYITYKPFSWLYFTGGRVGNPFYAPTTLIWGDDLSLEGALVGLTPHIGDNFKLFGTAGLFPIQDVEPTPLTESKSKWLYGYQGGFSWQFVPRAGFKLAGALYDYRHVEGIPNATLVSTDFNLTAAPFRQKGNSVFDIDTFSNTVNGTQNYLIGLASRFREANVTATVDLAIIGGKHLVLDADYVKNIGFDHNEILARTGLDLPQQTKGMQEKLTVGDLSFARRNAWQAYIGYRHVESDAVLDAFTDADFRLGGTDATGYYLGGRYAFEPNSTIGFRWFSAKQIDGLPLAIDVLQIDLIAAF
jgi:hypothetical protein